jgi:hypothetical protein
MSNKFILLVVAAFVAPIIIVAGAQNKDTEKQPAAVAAQPAETTAETMWCDPVRTKAEVTTMIEAKIITDLDIGKLGQTGGMSVTVDEPTWTNVSFDRKEVIADDVACVITGGKSTSRNYLSISLLSNMSRKRLGYYSRGTLTVD